MGRDGGSIAMSKKIYRFEAPQCNGTGCQWLPGSRPQRGGPDGKK